MPKKNDYPVPDMTGYISPKTKEYNYLSHIADLERSGGWVQVDYAVKTNFCKNFGRDTWELYEELQSYWRGRQVVTVKLNTLLYSLEWGKDKYYSVVEKAEKFGILKAETCGSDGIQFTHLLDYRRDDESYRGDIPRGTFPVDFCKAAYEYTTTPHKNPNSKVMSLNEYKQFSKKLRDQNS